MIFLLAIRLTVQEMAGKNLDQHIINQSWPRMGVFPIDLVLLYSVFKAHL